MLKTAMRGTADKAAAEAYRTYLDNEDAMKLQPCQMPSSICPVSRTNALPLRFEGHQP